TYHKEMNKKDPKYVSAASVDKPINSDSVEISGGFKGEKGIEEAKQIADLLNSGSLPVDLNEIYSNSVGAQFGQDALDKTIFAAAIGIAVIYLFMLGFYRLPGLVAVIALTVYIYLTLVAFNFISGVLTLPGLAALVLGVGMAVDANIIMYERIKDELKIGRTLKQAYKKANKSSFLTIVDAQLTTVIAAAVLFFFGESSVKGFATMLLLGILMIFVTVVVLFRWLLSLLVSSNFFKKSYWLFGVNKHHIADINEGKEVHDLKTPYERWDFMKLAKPLLSLSVLILIVGAVILFIFKLNLGIDFTSGTRVDFESKDKISEAKVTKTLEDQDFKPTQVSLGENGKNATVQFKNDLSKDEVSKIKNAIDKSFGNDPTVNKKKHKEKDFKPTQVNLVENSKNATVQFKNDLSKDEVSKIKNTIDKSFGNDPTVNTVSPVIGQELAKNAMMALLYAAIGIIIYITFRFEWRMGLSSVLALLHDAFMIVAVFSLFRLEVDITFIAAVLTIIGYSINDT